MAVESSARPNRFSRTQVAAAKALVEFDRRRGSEPEDWVLRIANSTTEGDPRRAGTEATTAERS